MTRVKVLSRSAVFAWSPKSNANLSLVAGTSAQQWDASFSSSAALELCKLDDLSPPVDLNPAKSIEVNHRFHRLIWSEYTTTSTSGSLIGGCDNGIISIWDADSLTSGGDPKCVHQSQRHSGHVLALDSSRLQSKLLVSGAAASEVFIWDLNQPDTPMTPGPKQQPFDQIVCVQWNRKVEHILGSLTSGRALLWDLRKTDGPILSLGDLGVQWKQFCWHPEQATSLVLASEDDSNPLVQMWDVRFANAPVLQMSGHTKGILSLDWCTADPDLLVTCGKDMKLYLWNPNSGQQLAEIPYAARNWPHQVSWCEGNPNLIGCASVDGRVTVYSLVGGEMEAQSGLSPMPSPKLADSFPGADFSHTLPVSQPSQQITPAAQSVQLPQVPRWLRPGPCCARFGFGGKLISFGKEEEQTQSSGEVPRTVDVTQVITESEVYNRNVTLQAALDSGQLTDYCEQKASNSKSESERMLWEFLSTHCKGCSRQQFSAILRNDDVYAKSMLEQVLGPDSDWRIGPNATEEREEEEGSVQTDQGSESVDTPQDSPRRESQLIFGPLNLSVDPNSIPGQISHSLLSGNVSAAVELCIRNDQWADALQLALSVNDQLFNKVQKLYANEMGTKRNTTSRLVALLSAGDWDELVDSVTLENWRHVLALMLSYAGSDKFCGLAVRLAERLCRDESGQYKAYGPLLSVMANAVDRLVTCLEPKLDDPASVQDVVEKATVLRWSIGSGSQRVVSAGQQFSAVLTQYATLLATQGCVENALRLLQTLPQDAQLSQELLVLRDRLSGACGAPAKARPFQVTPVLSAAEVQTRRSSIAARPPAHPSATRQPPQAQVENYHQLYQQYQQYYQQQAPMSNQYSNPMQSHGQMPLPPPLSMPSAAQYAPPPTSTVSQSHIGTSIHSRSRYPSYRSEGISYPGTGSGQGSPVQPAAPPNPFGAGAPGYQPQAYANPPMSQQQYNPPGPPPQQAYPGYPEPTHRNPPIAAVPPRPATDRSNIPWNDPPMAAAPKQSKSNSSVPAPLTQPVLGPNPAEAPPPMMMGGFAPPMQMQQQAPPMKAQQPIVEEKELLPMPAEHLAIQQVLDRIIELCLNQRGTPIMRKHVENSKVKIESQLYSRLRGQRLSQATTTNLHYFIQYIQARDYGSALAMHSQMVQGQDFAEISHFMPALKTLVQTAAQLGVYYG